MKNKPLFYVFVFVLLVSTVFACDYTDYFDADSPYCFNLEEGDYDLITDWSEIAWEDIPIDRIQEIPADVIDYSQLNEDQRLEMTSEQISLNFDDIEDLGKDVNHLEAMEAIKLKYSIIMEGFGNGANIMYGVLSATTGNREWISLEELSHDCYVEVDPNGNIIVSGSTTLPYDGSYTFIQEDEETRVKFSDEFEVSILGELKVDKGRIFVEQNTETTINDFKISSTTNDVEIYFGEIPLESENYFSFLDDKMISIGTTRDGEVIVEAIPGNELFSMQTREYFTDDEGETQYRLIPDKNSYLKIEMQGGDSLHASSRKDAGLTPFITHSNGGGTTKVNNGRLDFTIHEDEIILGKTDFKYNRVDLEGNVVYDYRNSAAFEFVSLSQENNFPLRVSSSNRFSFFDRYGNEIIGTNMGLEVSNSWETNMMKTVDDLNVKYGKIRFEGTVYTANAIQTLDQWFRNKPEIEQYISEVEFTTKEELGVESNKLFIGSPLLDPDLFIKTYTEIGFGEARSIFVIFDHEFTHSLDDYVDTKEKREQPEDRETLGSLYKSYALSLSKKLYSDPEFKRILEEIEEVIKSRDEYYETIKTENDIEEADKIFTLATEVIEGDEINLQLYKKLTSKIEQETSLYPYVFKEYDSAYEAEGVDSDMTFAELSATYAQVPPEKAKRDLYLAQLEFDRACSADPPEWVREQAEERYYEIVGGREGDYCSNYDCGPCIVYTATCDPNAGLAAE